MEQKPRLNRIYDGSKEAIMGEVRVEIQLENQADRYLQEEGRLNKDKIRFAKVDAVVDTGAVMVLLPGDLVEKLGLHISDTMSVVLANEEKIQLGVAGTLSLTVCGREMKTDCLVGPSGCEALLGQLVLERLDLIVDPRRQLLTARPESPFLPTLNMRQAAVFAGA